MTLKKKVVFEAACNVPDTLFNNRGSGTLQFKESTPELEGKSKTLSFYLSFSDQKGYSSLHLSFRASKLEPIHAEISVTFGKSVKWWEMYPQPNMIHVNSPQELVYLLLNAGDNLVIVEFYSPACGACKALHRKICQLAELNTDAPLLKVNYEQHKQMCQAMFMFYPSLDSTEAQRIKKFKDALAKHGTERCSLGAAKGLDESELLSLASTHHISAKRCDGSEVEIKVPPTL